MSINHKDSYFMRIALDIANGSKCVRAQYGSVIVSKDGRIISTGYNGKPRGSSNDHICYRVGLEDNAAKPNCCLHSEANALLFSSPLDRSGGTIYVSGRPCTDCLLLILQSGLSRLVYLDEDNPNGHKGNVYLAGENINNSFISEYGFCDKLIVDTIRKGDLHE